MTSSCRRLIKTNKEFPRLVQVFHEWPTRNGYTFNNKSDQGRGLIAFFHFHKTRGDFFKQGTKKITHCLLPVNIALSVTVLLF